MEVLAPSRDELPWERPAGHSGRDRPSPSLARRSPRASSVHPWTPRLTLSPSGSGIRPPAPLHPVQDVGDPGRRATEPPLARSFRVPVVAVCSAQGQSLEPHSALVHEGGTGLWPVSEGGRRDSGRTRQEARPAAPGRARRRREGESGRVATSPRPARPAGPGM